MRTRNRHSTVCNGIVPYKVSINPTKRCNAKCIMCPFWTNLEKKPALAGNELAKERIISLLDELGALGTKWISFSGGEPFIRNDILDLIRHAKRLGFGVTIYTNGSLVTQEVADQLLDANTDQVRFSLDGPSPEVHDKIRRLNGLWRKAVEAIAFLVERREQLNKKTRIIINTVVMKANYSHLFEIVRLAGKLHVDDCVFIPVYENPSLGHENPLRFPVEADEIARYNLKVAPKISGTSKSRRFTLMNWLTPANSSCLFNKVMRQGPEEKTRLLDNTYCPTPWFYAFVDYDGSTYPCCSLQRADFLVGNLNESSFKQIWDGRQFANFRRAFLPPSYPQCLHKCPGVWKLDFTNAPTTDPWSK